MATPATKPLGVTAPLSTALPTESENQASNALIEELKRQNNYESSADTQKRYSPHPGATKIPLVVQKLIGNLQNRCVTVTSRNHRRVRETS
jgi:poly(A) polymerase Pap1